MRCKDKALLFAAKERGSGRGFSRRSGCRGARMRGSSVDDVDKLDEVDEVDEVEVVEKVPRSEVDIAMLVETCGRAGGVHR